VPCREVATNHSAATGVPHASPPPPALPVQVGPTSVPGVRPGFSVPAPLDPGSSVAPPLVPVPSVRPSRGFGSFACRSPSLPRDRVAMVRYGWVRGCPVQAGVCARSWWGVYDLKIFLDVPLRVRDRLAHARGVMVEREGVNPHPCPS
jgi:hypothetical protein